MDSISYLNGSANPSFLARTIDWTVNDGGASSNVATSTIDVVPGPAAMLVFSSQPAATVTSGGGFALTVEAEDQYGNQATPYTGNVTIALLNNPGNSTLGGNLTVAAIQGLATFAGLSVNNVGTGYTLLAMSGSLTSAVSNSFSVAQGPAITAYTAGQPSALTYGVRTGAQAVDPYLTMVDNESNTIIGATVAISSGYVATEDELNAANQNGITASFNSTTGTLILAGTATVAQYQTALDSVTYIDLASNPSFAQRTVTFSATDGNIPSSPATYTINLVPGKATQLLIMVSRPIASMPASALVLRSKRKTSTATWPPVSKAR